MNIKTWQEREASDDWVPDDQQTAMQAEIDELRKELELARIKTYLVSISEIAVERDALQTDAERLDTLESLHQSDLKTDIHIGGFKTASLYQRTGIGSQLHEQGHGKTVRQMIDAIKGKL